MATKFSMKDPNPGAWFSFDENDPESGRIRIRVANIAILRELDKRWTKKRVEFKQGQRFEVQDRDEIGYSNALWDYCIPEWERLEDDDDVPIECTTENKLKLMTEDVGFSLFVNNCISRLREAQEQLEQEMQKNDESTSSDY